MVPAQVCNQLQLLQLHFLQEVETEIGKRNRNRNQVASGLLFSSPQLLSCSSCLRESLAKDNKKPRGGQLTRPSWLILGKKVTTQTGVFLPTGRGVILGRKVTMQTGVFLPTGRGVILGRKVTVQTGVFLPTGRGVILGRKVTIQTGVFLPTGRGVILGRKVTIQTGVFLPTGRVVILGREVTMQIGVLDASMEGWREGEESYNPDR